jgi:AAA family ATP:ADP antiporter
MFGSLANSTPYLGGILLVIVLAWLGAARSLDKQFSSLAKEELRKEMSAKEKAEAAPLVEPEAATDVLVEQPNGTITSGTTGTES